MRDTEKRGARKKRGRNILLALNRFRILLNSEELELCAYIYMHLTLVPSKIFQGAAEGCGAVSRRSVQNLAVPREASSAAARTVARGPERGMHGSHSRSRLKVEGPDPRVATAATDSPIVFTSLCSLIGSTIEVFGRFRQNVARFRLYRHRFLQVNRRFAAFFKIYQII